MCVSVCVQLSSIVLLRLGCNWRAQTEKIPLLLLQVIAASDLDAEEENISQADGGGNMTSSGGGAGGSTSKQVRRPLCI